MLACFRPSVSVSKKRKGEISLVVGIQLPASPQVNDIASNREIDSNKMHLASADSASTSDSDTQALYFHILSHSPNLISIFKDNPNSQEVVYQNEKSLEYYGDLKAADSKDSSLCTHILKSLLSFEKLDVTLNSVLSELESTGSWTGSIKVPLQLIIGQGSPEPVHKIVTSACHEIESASLLGLIPNITNLLNLPDPISAPITLDQVSAFSASFRKAPLRVKSLLMPSLQTMYMNSTGSRRASIEMHNTGECSKTLSSRGVISRTATDSKDIVSSPLFVRKSEDVARTALESETPQLLSPSVAGSRSPQLLSMGLDHHGRSLIAWEEEEEEEEIVEEGVALAYASANKSNNPGERFQWHDIDVKKIQHPTTGEPLIIVTQNEVTIRVAMEKAMLTCADTQLNMVSSIFPAHVVEYFNQSTSKNFVNELQQDIGHLARSHKDVTILFMVSRPTASLSL